MSTFSEVGPLVAAIFEATNKVEAAISTKLGEKDAQIDALKAQLAAGEPVTSEQLDALKADLSAELAHLQAMGADAADPVPEPPVA